MDSETELYFSLIYPPITCINSFVDALPDCVVESVIIGLRLRDKFEMALDLKRTYIRIMLAQPKNNPIVTPVIWSVLESYHDLQD